MNYTVLVCIVSAFAFTSCDKSSDELSASVTPNAVESELKESESNVRVAVDFSAVAVDFQQAADTQLKETITQCRALQSSIESFLASPNDEALSTSQLAFVPCYRSWKSASLFFQTPFSIAEQKAFNQLVDLIDTRPFQPGYIDGIAEYPFSGLVHDLDVAISSNNVRGQHRLMDEESASVGFPVIEFFLWKGPTDEFWIEQSSSPLAERRLDYLNLAMKMLSDQLNSASLRWKVSGGFTSLPEPAQMDLVLKSLQRLTMVELLGDKFESTAITEPEWHHSALISGNGRQYIEQQLQTIGDVVGQNGQTTSFSLWLNNNENLPMDAQQLQDTIAIAIAAVKLLPENYPFDTENDETWLAAQQAIATTALMFSQLSQAMQVSILTQ